MLTNLHIRDFTIITETEMELGTGMTALTGETGAGKSILLDAIGLVLGDRMDASTVRDGATRAEITASFSPANTSPVWTWLQDNDLDDDGQCMLRRVVPVEGKSRGYVNGRPVSMQMLRTVGEMLVDIHGQHEHFTLTRRQTQRAIVDSALKSTTLLDQVAEGFHRWQEKRDALADYTSRSQQRSERVDLLRFQLQEFDTVEPGRDKPEDLESEFNRAANAGKLLELATQVLDALEEDNHNAESLLSSALRQLQQLESLDSSVGDIAEMINTAVILTNEASAAMRLFKGDLDVDPARLSWLDERLSQLHRLAQKHQTTMHSLADVENKIRKELDGLLANDQSLDELQREVDALWEVYLAQAKKLSALRLKAARKLSKDVTTAMHSLGMQGGLLACDVVQDTQHPGAHGIDSVHFLISPNPGSKPGEMSKIASGGELSRISLAIALASSSENQRPTLIFDEVDSGIGGAVAETVGQFLRSLGSKTQVLCVTHLPQVAAQAHGHIKVSKSAEKGKTTTELDTLDETQTVDEIARMLGGAKITKKSRLHAQEMLDTVG